MKVPGRCLGIDFGTKRIGLAVSDPLQMIAQGVSALPNDTTFLSRLLVLIDDLEIVRVIVGMPYSEDGGIGSKGKEVERFVQHLRERLTVDVDTWDESLTSVEAEKMMIESGMRRKKRQRKGEKDVMAARILLQGYLDNATR
jgi:putative holliday junction resolvase